MCGKVATPDAFEGKLSDPTDRKSARVDPHDLDAVVQVSLSRPGVRGGFKWTPEPLEPDELQKLRDVAYEAGQRIDEALGGSTREDDDTEVDDAENDNERLRENVERLQGEVANMIDDITEREARQRALDRELVSAIAEIRTLKSEISRLKRILDV